MTSNGVSAMPYCLRAKRVLPLVFVVVLGVAGCANEAVSSAGNIGYKVTYGLHSKPLGDISGTLSDVGVPITIDVGSKAQIKPIGDEPDFNTRYKLQVENPKVVEAAEDNLQGLSVGTTKVFALQPNGQRPAICGAETACLVLVVTVT